jgi:hypothetical protein
VRAVAALIFALAAQAAWAVPTFTSTPVTAVNEDSPYAYSITTNDTEVGTRLVTATVLPGWLQLANINIVAGTATLQGTPTQAQVGSHPVTLLVANQFTGSTATQSFTVVVNNVNDPPTFTSTPVTAASEDQLYTYNITTADPDTGQQRTISATTLPAWLTLSNVNAGAGTATLSGTPTQAQVGAHSVTLRVTDNGSPAQFATQSFTVTVANVNDPPTFTSTPVTSAQQGALYSYSITTADPDTGQQRTIAAAPGSPLPAWLSLTNVNAGAGTATLSGTPTQAQVGTHSVTLRVTDNGSPAEFANQSFTITVSDVNDPPTFTSTPVTSASQGTLYTYNITTADPDTGQTRTITATTLPAWLTLSNVNATAGTATLSGTPAQAQVGPHSVTLRVTDSGSPAEFATQTFTITVGDVNDPPTFTSTPVTAAQQNALYTYSITTADPDTGQTRTIAAAPGSPLPAWLALSNVNTTAGTATLSGTPAQAQVGTHSVTLRVTDSGSPAQFATQAFTITVGDVNDAPTFTSTPVTAATQGQTYTYNVTTADPDTGQTRTIAAAPGAALPPWLTLSSVNATAGTATLTGSPTQAQVGTPQQVTLRVTDNGAPPAFANQTFTITVADVNDAPRVRAPIPAQFASENTPFQLVGPTGAPTTLAAFFEDVDPGDTLTYQVTSVPPLPPRIVANPTTGAISGTPIQADSRDTPYVVQVTASDGKTLPGLLPTQTFNLTIAALDRADLSVSAAAAPTPVTTNADVDWTFTVANAGPQTSGAVTLTAEFAGNPFSFTSLGTCSVTPASDRQVVTCSGPPLAPGGSAAISVSGRAAQPGDVNVIADVRGAGNVPIDPNAMNNRSVATVNVAQTLSTGPAQLLPSPDTTGAAAGDVNGDGFVDLVLAKGGGRSTEVHLNVVSPTNSAQRLLAENPLALPDATPSSDVALVDLDNDGDLDLVTANATGVSNNVFVNDGAGTFTLFATLGAGNSNAVAAADLDGDGLVDLAFANSSPNGVYRNTGGVSFTQSDSIDDDDSRAVVVADFDLDTLPDLVFANANGPSRFAKNTGGGQFANGVTIDSQGALAVATGDFNGDGRPDLALARTAAAASPPSIVIYQNNPGGPSAPLFVLVAGIGATPVVDLVAADFDLDGATDIVAISATGTHQLYRGNGAGGFSLHPVQFTSTAPTGAAPGNFSVDDRVDLAVGGGAGTGVFFNDGRGGLGGGDTVPPVIQLNGEATVSVTVEAAYQDAGATATDVIDGNLTTRIVTNNPVNTALVGTYTVTYDVRDNSGNAAVRQTRTVRVEPREGTGGGGGGAVGAPFALLVLLLYLIVQAQARAGRRRW